MKYYDGMGRDVTEYVTGLEKQLEELKAKLPTEEKPVETVEPEEVGFLEDVPKPKTRRSRS